MGIQRKEAGLTFSRIEKKTLVLRLALLSKQSSLCVLHSGRDRGGGGPDGQIVNTKRAADKNR